MFVAATIFFAVDECVYVLCHEGAVSLNGLITFQLKLNLRLVLRKRTVCAVMVCYITMILCKILFDVLL